MEWNKDAQANNFEPEHSLDSWNYAADLDLLKIQLLNSELRGIDRATVRVLIRACLGITTKPFDQSRETNNKQCEAGSSHKTPIISSEKVLHEMKMNPLEIPLILNHVLGYLPLKDLLQSRLVNQSWNHRSLPLIRETKSERCEVEPHDFSKFCETFEKSGLFPMSKLGIWLDRQSLFHCQQFFCKHGSAIEDLQIAETGSRGFGKLKNIIKLRYILRHVPNLKKLKIYLNSASATLDGMYTSDYNECVFDKLTDLSLTKMEELSMWTFEEFRQEFLLGLFSVVPNIKVLKTNKFVGSRPEIEALSSVLKNVNLHSISHHTDCDESPEVLAIFGRTQKLKSLILSLNISTEPGSMDVVNAQRALLKSQSETLEMLSLIGQHPQEDEENRWRDAAKLHLPVMQNVRTLTLSMDSENAEIYTYSNHTNAPFCIVPVNPEQVPKLRLLRVDHRILRTAIEDSAFTSVMEIDLGGWREANCGILPEIKSRFPRLRKLINLCTTLQESEVSLIVSNLQSIEELELDIWDESEEPMMQNFNFAISGIPVESKWILTRLHELLGKESARDWIDPPGPSFRELKRLTKLRLTFDFEGENECFPTIDEIGVYFTFLRLSPKLKLCLNGNFYIADNLAAKMTSHYQNVYFNFNHEKLTKSRVSDWE